MSNKDVKQGALDNLADALTEDILNTPDDELLREVEDDYGNPRALANKFDLILERAEKQVFGTARSAASPQVRSSVLDLPYRLLEWFLTLFGSGPARSETQFQLFSVNRMIWAGAAAVLIVLILAPVVFRSVSEFDETRVVSSVPQAPPPDQNSKGSRLALAPPVAPGAPPADAATDLSPTLVAPVAGVPPVAAAASASITNATPEEIAKAVGRGQQLLAQGQIAEARQLLLRWGLENATAALALGASYDPIDLKKLPSVKSNTASPNTATSVTSVSDSIRQTQASPKASSNTPMAYRASPKPESSNTASPNVLPDAFADIAMARTWYQKAKDLGSIEAARRLESLTAREGQRR